MLWHSKGNSAKHSSEKEMNANTSWFVCSRLAKMTDAKMAALSETNPWNFSEVPFA